MQWVAKISTIFETRLETTNDESIFGEGKKYSIYRLYYTLQGLLYIYTPEGVGSDQHGLSGPWEKGRTAHTSLRRGWHIWYSPPDVTPDGPAAPPIRWGPRRATHTHIHRYTHHMQRPRMGRQARGGAPPSGGGGSGLREDALVMCGAARRCMDSCGGHLLFFHSLGGTLE